MPPFLRQYRCRARRSRTSRLRNGIRMMAVNLRGMFLASKAILPHMKQRRWGRIINISSGGALSNTANSIHYVTSKAGVLGFTRTLAREVGAFGVTVNTIAPGSTLSEENPSDEVVRMRSSRIEARAIPRLQLPDDLVGAACSLHQKRRDSLPVKRWSLTVGPRCTDYASASARAGLCSGDGANLVTARGRHRTGFPDSSGTAQAGWAGQGESSRSRRPRC